MAAKAAKKSTRRSPTTSRRPGDGTGVAKEASDRENAEQIKAAQERMSMATQVVGGDEDEDEILDLAGPEIVGEEDDAEEIVVVTALDDINCRIGTEFINIRRGQRARLPISTADFLGAWVWY